MIRNDHKRRKRFSRKALLLLCLPIAATGCAGQPTQISTTARHVATEQALVMPPPAGPAVLSVIEHRYDNAIEQDIFLHTSAQTPGQNSFKVQFFGTVSPFRLSDNKLTSVPVTPGGIASEMRKALPGIRMARSSFYVQNSYGPFGYAFGRSASADLCMYAWQQIRSPNGTVSPFANFGSIQVRLRYCQADATEQQLLTVMYNYTITGSVDSNGWNPYGEPKSVSPDLGGTGAPVYPRPGASDPVVEVLPPKPSVVRVRPATTPRRAAAAQPAYPAQPGYPMQSAYPMSAGGVAGTLPPGGQTVTVPRPSNLQQPNRYPSAPAGQPASRPPIVPSPSAAVQPDRTLPSPSTSCDRVSVTANACR